MQASDKIENQLKGLPDVKGTKYIEMGRFQIEVLYVQEVVTHFIY